jgi:hypothetical protein
MVSNTGQTRSIRANHRRKAGKKRKRMMTKRGTPAFPIQPVGYDPKAADAKPITAVKKDKD